MGQFVLSRCNELILEPERLRRSRSRCGFHQGFKMAVPSVCQVMEAKGLAGGRPAIFIYGYIFLLTPSFAEAEQIFTTNWIFRRGRLCFGPPLRFLPLIVGSTRKSQPAIAMV